MVMIPRSLPIAAMIFFIVISSIMIVTIIIAMIIGAIIRTNRMKTMMIRTIVYGWRPALGGGLHHDLEVLSQSLPARGIAKGGPLARRRLGSCQRPADVAQGDERCGAPR